LDPKIGRYHGFKGVIQNTIKICNHMLLLPKPDNLEIFCFLFILSAKKFNSKLINQYMEVIGFTKLELSL